MNRTIRGMAGLLVALGASACANDWSLDFGGPPTQVQASPDAMFITSGAAPKELLLRLVNDRNQSIPAEWTVTNVPSGMTVVKDANYRPDWINDDDTLTPDALQVQHRYFVSANIPTGGQFTFTVASQGISKQVTVRVLPTSLGASLSATAPALGEEVTIPAPATMSFNASTSTVTFTPGGAAVITNRSATSISFLPRPGSQGPATVTNVTLNYAPTLAPRTLTTANSITVPGVSNVVATYNPANPALFATTTVTAPGFKFLPSFRLGVGGFSALTVSVAADSLSAVVRLPAGVTGSVPTFSNVVLGFLTEVPLNNVPGTNPLTTPPTPWAGNNPDATAPIINAAAPGTVTTFYDTWRGFGGDCCGFGGNNKWYRINITTAGTYTISLNWSQGGSGTYADMDWGLVDFGITTFLATRLTGNRPETTTATLAAGSYWLIVANFGNANDPGVMTITLQ
mgnify:CR=1 FL=1